MAVVWSTVVSLLVVMLLQESLQGSPGSPGCPPPCCCQEGVLVNCSSAGLALAPATIQTVAAPQLDLTHNLLRSLILLRPNLHLRRVWLGSNSITRLSLCVEGTWRPRPPRRRLRPPSRGQQGCVSWAPALQLLSAERNQLLQLPTGLQGSGSLQVLHLSYNRISTLGADELSDLQQLQELHLQHNLIRSIHPQAFRHLASLTVLDLSFNRLTTLPPSTFLALRGLGVEVQAGGNAWHCDCGMWSVRRWMVLDTNGGQRSWGVVCASPSALAGRDLLQLEDQEWPCDGTWGQAATHHNVTLERGSSILLPCPALRDSTWWTPKGEVSVEQWQAGLLLTDITEKDAGLYVCVSESQHQEVVSVFNLQLRSEIKKKNRTLRSLPRSSQPVMPKGIHWASKAGKQNSDLTLAVCLSVLITFLVAFVLGVVSRPLIDFLWGKVCTKTKVPSPNSASSTGQRPYENEAYCDDGEPEEVVSNRERRVTLSTVDLREQSSTLYYDTVARGNQENINENAVVDLEATNARHQSEKTKTKSGESGSKSKLSSHSLEANVSIEETTIDPTNTTEFEHIPDPDEVEYKGSSSSHSDDEQKEEKITQKDPWQPPLSELVSDPFQKNTNSRSIQPVDVPQISIDGQSEVVRLSLEPFTNCNDSSLRDQDQWSESGENFEFTDSIQSGSARSSSIFSSINHSNQNVFPSSKNRRHSDRSSCSSDASNEPTQYTVNPERDEGERADVVQNAQLMHDTKPESTGPYPKESVNFEEQTKGRFSPQEAWPYQGQASEDSNSSQSSDSDDKITQSTVTQEQAEGDKHHKPARIKRAQGDQPMEASSMGWTDLEPEARCPAPNFGSGRDMNILNSAAPVPPPPTSSSTSESEEETWGHKGGKKKDRTEVGIASHDTADTQWPVLDLERIPRIRRRLDIKTPFQPPDITCSSGSHKTTKLKMREEGGAKPSGSFIKESEIEEANSKWPELDLSSVSHTKRSLDIKASSPPADSSSSDESEGETKDHSDSRSPEIKNRVGINIRSTAPDSTSSSSESEDETGKSAVKVESGRDRQLEPKSLKVSPLTRKPNITASSPKQPHSSSSCSESENQMSIQRVKQEIGRSDVEVPSQEPTTKWPDLSLGVPRIARRLDIRAPSPQPSQSGRDINILNTAAPIPPPSNSSSSTSESEEEILGHKGGKKKDRTEVGIASHDTADTRWPVLDLERIPRIRRRLDIKAPFQPPDITWSSGSHKTTKLKMREEGGVKPSGSFIKESEIEEANSKWPELDLSSVSHTKRSLDIKASSPPADSSSSDESEGETKDHSNSRWPEIKNRVGISIRSTAPDSTSSSSESEDETGKSAVKVESGRDRQLEPKSLKVSPLTRKSNITASSPKQPHSSSSCSESENQMSIQRVKQEIGRSDVEFPSQEPTTKWPDLSLGVPRVARGLDIRAPSPQPSQSGRDINILNTAAPIPPPPTSSSTSESEEETWGHKGGKKKDRTEVGIASHDTADTQWPVLDLERIPRIRRRLDIKTPFQSPDITCSSGSHKTTKLKMREEGGAKPSGSFIKESEIEEANSKWPELDLSSVSHTKRSLDIKASSPPADSSSSDESEGETKDHSDSRSPEIKNRVGINIRSTAPDSTSSSSESEDETGKSAVKVESGRDRQLEPKSLKVSPLTRKPNITASSPKQPHSSSSCSESENQMSIQRVKQEIGRSDVEFPSQEPTTKWPDLSLGVPRVARGLDIRAPSPQPSQSGRDINILNTAAPIPPPPTSSSTSESEEETWGHKGGKKKDRTEVGIASHDTADTQWPVLDLERIPRIRRRLDIKTPFQPPDITCSSGSHKTTKLKMREEGGAKPSGSFIKESEIEEANSKWPELDLSSVSHTKRSLDIKASSPPADSSSSDESEGETKDHSNSRWPEIKNRVGISIRSTAPDSTSSSSESEDETGKSAVKVESGRDRQLEPKSLKVSPLTRKSNITASSPKQPHSSSSCSESENQMSIQRVKQEIGRSDVEFPSQEPTTKWPDLSLGVPRVARGLDIRAPSPQPSQSGRDINILNTAAPIPPPPTSSSTSESEEETWGHKGGKKKDRTEVGIASHDTADTQWPVLDLERIPRIRRRLDIKTPFQPPDITCSSGSHKTTKLKMREEGGAKPSGSFIKESEIEEANSKWPELDLSSVSHTKRSLDIKASSPPADSSSSDESEGETKDHSDSRSPEIKNRVGINIRSTAPDSTSSSSESEDETGKSAVKVESGRDRQLEPKSLKVSPLTRKPNITASSPKQPHSSSSCSESENQMSIQRVKQEIGRSDVEVPSQEPTTKWPDLSLGVPRVARRLDIRAPSPQPSQSGRDINILNTAAPIPPPSNSSSSTSESEEEILGHKGGKKKDRTEVGIASHDTADTRWPVLDLERIPRIRRRLDIKAPFQPPDITWSSGSHKTTKLKMREEGGVKPSGSFIKESEIEEANSKWPELDLSSVSHTKRSLDIKASSPPADSSSSDESEGETKDHSNSRWPEIKNRVGISIRSTAPDSTSSSSESEDETGKSAVKVESGRDRQLEPKSLKVSPLTRKSNITASSPKQPHSSSSCSESENLMSIQRVKQEIGRSDVEFPSQEPTTKWPDLSLGVPRVARGLDIRAPSPQPSQSGRDINILNTAAPIPPPSNSSSSTSESEEEILGHKGGKKKDRTEVGIASHDTADTRWPVLDLERIPRIRRRLDIKAPFQPPDITWSSGSHKTTKLKMREEGGVKPSGSFIKESEIEEANSKWPELDLSSVSHIKRSLDIKASSPPADSSSSDESEGETKDHSDSRSPEIKNRVGINIRSTAPDSTSSSSESEDETGKSAVKVESGRDRQLEPKSLKVYPLTRKSNITASSPKQPHSSSSCSESENQMSIQRVKQEIGRSDVEFPSQEPTTKWPDLSLGVPRVARRLDIRAPSPQPSQSGRDINILNTAAPIPPPSNSSSSTSESEEEILGHKGGKKKDRTEVGIASHDTADTRWPVLDLERIPRIRRRLDIKAPFQPPDITWSSGSHKTTKLKMREEGGAKPSGSFIKESEIEEANSKWPELDLSSVSHIKRSLDIKASSPPADSSSSDESEGETKDHSDSRSPEIKNRVGINIRSTAPDSTSSSSESEDETGKSAVKVESGRDRQLEPKSLKVSPLTRKSNITASSPKQPHSSSSCSESENQMSIQRVKQEIGRSDVEVPGQEPTTKWPDLSLGVPRIARRLDIRAPSPQPSHDTQGGPVPLQAQIESSSSENEDEKQDNAGKLGREPVLSQMIKQKSILSTKDTNDPHIKLKMYAIITDEVKDNYQSSTPRVNPEQESHRAGLSVGISRFRKRLDISSHKDTSPKLSSLTRTESSFSSSKGDEQESHRDKHQREGMEVQEITQSRDKSVDLSKNVTGADDSSSESSVEALPPIPFGKLPDSSSSSDTDDETTDQAGERGKETAQQSAVQERSPQNIVSLYPKRAHQSEGSIKSRPLNNQTAEEERGSESKWPDLSISGVPHIKRRLDIRVASPLRSVSASSRDSEDETTVRRTATADMVMTSADLETWLPNLDKGVPREGPYLTIKTSLPQNADSSSSSSESEYDSTVKQRRDGTVVTQIIGSQSQMVPEPKLQWPDLGFRSIPSLKRRLDLKPMPQHDSSPSRSDDETDEVLIETVKREYLPPNISIDEVARRIEKAQGATDVALAPELRWTTIGHNSSELPIGNQRRPLGVRGLPPQDTPPAVPGRPPPDSPSSSSSIESEDDTKQVRQKADIMPLPVYLTHSPARSIFLTSRADLVAAPVNSSKMVIRDGEKLSSVVRGRRDKKGLSALRAVSSERRRWDSVYKEPDRGTSVLSYQDAPKLDFPRTSTTTAEAGVGAPLQSIFHPVRPVAGQSQTLTCPDRVDVEGLIMTSQSSGNQDRKILGSYQQRESVVDGTYQTARHYETVTATTTKSVTFDCEERDMCQSQSSMVHSSLSEQHISEV